MARSSKVELPGQGPTDDEATSLGTASGGLGERPTTFAPEAERGRGGPRHG